MTSLTDCRCIRCDGDLIFAGDDTAATIPGAISCGTCEALYDQVWGVPVLAHYEQADFAALVETAANAEQCSPFTPESLEKWQAVLRGYHLSADKAAYLKTLSPGDAKYVPNRYTEWEALERLTDGESFNGLKVLDTGAGLGFDAYRLVLGGADVTALEFSPVLAREGKRTLPMMRWIGGMSHALPFKSATFDAVFCNAALHHMRDIPASFAEMLRVLRPGGLLITTGDPYRADHLDEKAEMAIFNSHPDVLGGVNEGVPRIGLFMETLEAVKSGADVQLFTQVVYPPGGGKREEFATWDMERDGPWLRRTSGSIAIKVRQRKSPDFAPRKSSAGRVLQPATLAGWMSDQSAAMVQLAAWAPDAVVNAPFPGAEPNKFEMLNGWRLPASRSWREAYRRARWYLRRGAEQTQLNFELCATRDANFTFLLNGEPAGGIATAAGVWQRVKIDLDSAPTAAPFAFEMQMTEPPANFEAGLFRVRNRRVSSPLQSERPPLMQRVRSIIPRLRRTLARSLLGDEAAVEAFGLARHKALATAGDHSFAGEEAQIRALLAKLGLASGYIVDIAASDGVTQSCTLGLFRGQGWRGLAVEYDATKFARLAYAYSAFPSVSLAKCKVTPENVAALLTAYRAPRDFELLSLDIDSYDLFVIAAMLDAGFRPKLISMEINEKLPPPLYFTVLYDDAHGWQGDHFFGCSATAAADTVRPYGYVLAGIEYNNAMFVEAGLAAAHGIADQDISSAYRTGYRDRADRTKLFPWNHNVDEALDLSPSDALAFFERHFANYQGKFTLRLSEEQRAAAKAVRAGS